ncbi:MAG TPA: D-alanine--D-alanine ligase [Candidatus Angelobacter sp.]|nr:D-alanine--D-alanine ligase [Candidatus Angelobacter sp.]
MSTTSPGRVVVLAGGLSPERDVSLRSGRRVAEALRLTGAEVEVRDVDADLLPSLAADPPACVVPLLHGAAGEDGALRDVLAALGLPVVGSDPVACRRAFDKPVASGLVSAAGVSVPPSVALPHSTFRELGAVAVLDAVVRRLGLPLMVKPTRGGSSLGATVVRTAGDLPAAMVAAFAYGDTALIERFVDGTEVAVSVLDSGDGPRALPVVEVVADGGFYDYAARYTAGATEFFTPARLADDVLAACASAAVRVHRTLGLRDWSRSDLVVDPAGTPWFLEVNVAPGMTETSTYPQAVLAAGLDLGAIVADLVTGAVNRG